VIYQAPMLPPPVAQPQLLAQVVVEDIPRRSRVEPRIDSFVDMQERDAPAPWMDAAPLPRIEPVLPKVAPIPPVTQSRVGHDPPSRARRPRDVSRRRQAFESPFVEQPKPSRAASRWERPLAIEARKPQPLFKVALAVILLVGLAALWRLGRDEAKSLPTAAVAASRPTPEPPVTPKVDEPTLNALGGDVWIHPLAGPERRMPVHDSRLFGADRSGDRPSECRGGHCGIDLGAAYGEPVYAVHDGVVDRVRRDANPDHGGHYVRLKHRDGTIVTQYFHLAEIPRRLDEGVKVKAGDVVGYVGLTGVKHSAPHLHFTIEVSDPSGDNARYLDPEPLVALWPLRVSQKGDEHLRLSNNAPPGLARGFLRTKRHRPHHAVLSD
jgi:murein DD-endopeptidase MepM/ murein hydrolase activator NlpD